MNALPIGIFDSGVGGLTVYRALKRILPHENFLYLGDTARLPYGTKTPDTIIQYALQAARLLIDAGIKFLVIACNTATGPALPVLRKRYPDLPIIGVIEPGAVAALAISKTKHIAVIATEATVAAHSYQSAIYHLDRTAQVVEKAAGLLVPLTEEGFLSGEIPCKIIHHYLDDLLADPNTRPDTLILGCTHFPVLAEVIHEVVGDRIQIVDSSRVVSEAVHDYFGAHPDFVHSGAEEGFSEFWVTDGVGRFMRVAERFLGSEIHAEQVRLVDFFS
jgi:glutamate racemase